MQRWLLLFTIFFNVQVFAQLDTCNLGKGKFALMTNGGYIIPHREEMRHLIQGHSVGAAIQFNQKTQGTKAWHKAYNYPELGLEISFNTTGNREQLGDQLALSYMIHLPLHPFREEEKKHFFKHYLSLGLGAGYATKKWELRDNTQSLVLGSHLNTSVMLQYGIALLQTKHIELRTGVRLHHLSNGAFQLPNLGTNNFLYFISLHQRRDDELKLNRSFIPFSPKWNTWIGLTGGAKEISPPGQKKYPSFTLHLLQERHQTFKSSFGLGLDMMFNSAVKALRERNLGADVAWKESARLGAVLSYGIHFNDFQLRIQQGVYVLNTWSGDGSLYHRFSLRYLIKDHITVQVGLKTHFAKADHAEIGIGWNL